MSFINKFNTKDFDDSVRRKTMDYTEKEEREMKEKREQERFSQSNEQAQATQRNPPEAKQKGIQQNEEGPSSSSSSLPSPTPGAKPSKPSIIDWTFLDNEYSDPSSPLATKKEANVQETPFVAHEVLPTHSMPLNDNMQMESVQLGTSSNVEGPKVQSRRGSLSVIDTIKTAIMKAEDPEDEPGFLERNPTWEDSLEPTNLNETKKEEQETEHGKLQRAFAAMANADGGVTITKHTTVAAKRWKNAYLTLKRLLALRKLERTSRVGPGAELDGRSLGLFPVKNPLRKIIFKLMFSQNAEYCLLILITAHLVILIQKATTNLSVEVKDRLVLADLVITILYTVECVLRIFTLGFIKGPHSYMKSNYNKLDFIIVVDSWVHIYQAKKGNDGFFRFASLRAFRALLSLRHFSFFANVIAIMDACQGSLVPLGNVLIFIAMIFSFYALVGVHFYGGKFKSRCIRKEDGTLPYMQEFCGTKGKDCDGNTTIVSYMSTFCVKGLECKGNLTIANGSSGPHECNEKFGNPNYGANNFDTFPQAILMLFQIVTFEGWALQMYNMQDSAGLNAEIYFIVMVIIGSYFAVNVCVAAISGVFIRVRHEHQVLLKKHKREQAFTFHNAIMLANVLKDVIRKDDAKLSWFGLVRRKTGSFNQNVTKFIRQGTKRISAMSNQGQSFLKRQISRGASFGARDSDSDFEDVDENELGGSFKKPKSFKTNKSMNRSMSRSLSRSLSSGAKSFTRSLSKNTHKTAHHVHATLTAIVRSQFFRLAELTLITTNFIILCFITANMSRKTENKIQHSSRILQIAFLVEMGLRAMAHGWKKYFQDSMNILDIVVVVVSLLSSASSKLPNISAVRLLRFFHSPRKQKFGKSDETPSPLMLCLRSFNILGSLSFFYMIVTIVFSIISMELYSGQFQVFPEGNPRENHDSFGSALLTWFGVSTGESWINQLWNAMRPEVRYRWISPYLFICYFILTTYILINLIIAVLLESTELTDNQKKAIQKREYLKYLRATHTHAKSIRTGDWLIGAIEGIQARVRRIYRNLSVMVPVSKSVKHVSIPLLENKIASQMDTRSPKNEGYQYNQDDAINSQDFLDNQGSSSTSLSEPQPSTPLHSILEMPEIKKKIYSEQSIAAKDNKLLQRKHSSFDPGLMMQSNASNITPIDQQSRDAILRRSSYNGIGGHSSRPRRLSKDATQMLVGAGFSNTTTHQDFREEKTALQSAMLALAHNLSMPSSLPLDDDIDANQHLYTTKEGEDDRHPSPKSKVDLYHSLSIQSFKGSSKRTSFNIKDYEGYNMKYRQVPWYFSDKSLFIFKSDGPTRRFLVFVVENIWYKRFIMICAIIAVYIVTQLNPAGFIDNVSIDLMDRFLLFTWTLDVVMKSIAYGVIFTPEAYLGDPYNIIDVVNMFFQWVGFNPPSEAYSRVVHIMNTIRGTRFIPRIQGLRLLVSSMLHTIPAVASMFGFILVIYFIFATIGIQIFRRRFAACTDPFVANRAQCVGTFINEVGLRSHRVWMNPPLHFDNFGSAMLALFVCSTTDGWIQYFLHNSEDIPNTLYDNPVQGNKSINSIFFILFIIISNWLVIRLLIGVFIDQFGIISGSKLLTERQKLWRDMNRIVQSLSPIKLPRIPINSVRRACYKLVHDSNAYRYCMILIILTNYCWFASQHYDVHQTKTVQSVEMGFVAFYLAEVVVKLFGNHFHDWYHDTWNVGELILVLGSSVCLYPDEGSVMAEWGIMFYLFRIFRIIRFLPNLSELVHTVLVSLPSLIYVVELLMIWLIEFGMIFYQTYPYINSGTCVNRDVNFERFLPSFIFSFQATTLDNWSCVMLELMAEPPYCVSSHGYHESSCGTAQSAIAYFVLIVYIMSHIITNLFIAQIIDTITFGLLNEDAMLSPKNLTHFQLLWASSEFDPLCSGYIGLQKLRHFVTKLGTPLGRRHNTPTKWYRFIQYEVYNFHVYGKGIPFRNFLETLVLYKIGSQGLILSLRIEREKQLKQIFRNGAAIVIQSHIRRFLVQRGFIVSHPMKIAPIIKEEAYDDYAEDSIERLKKKIMARLKVVLITGY